MALVEPRPVLETTAEATLPQTFQAQVRRDNCLQYLLSHQQPGVSFDGLLEDLNRCLNRCQPYCSPAFD